MRYCPLGVLAGTFQRTVTWDTEAHNLHWILFLNDRSIFCREENTLRLLATRLRCTRSEHQSTQNRGATRAFPIGIPATAAILSGTRTKRSTQETLTGALIMATTGVLGIHVHTREIEVRNTQIQTLTHRSTRTLELRTHSIRLLLTLNLHILELVISGTLTRLQPSIRGNITSISIEHLLMEAQGRNVVQALVRNTTGGGRVGVSHGNHNVRLIVCEAKTMHGYS